jgi:hypothetical protein
MTRVPPPLELARVEEPLAIALIVRARSLGRALGLLAVGVAETSFGLLAAVCYALASGAASIVWWSNALRILAPLAAALTAVIAVRRRRFLLAALNMACAAPYGVLRALCLVSVKSSGPQTRSWVVGESGTQETSP